MFTLRSAICALALAAPTFLTAGMASATVITGTSGGTFSDILSCHDDNCRINNTSNGNKTQLEWGYTNGFFGYGAKPGSTLTAVDRAWSQSTNANDVILAELVWFNRATDSNDTPDAFNAKYKLGINFTSPNASSDTELFILKIENTANTDGDYLRGLMLADLAHLSFSLNGVVISDLKYLLSGSGGTFNSNVWYNSENNTSRMYITADFTDEVVATAVPEPGSLVLLAAGFLSLSVLRRRRNV